ncbi:ABC transporter substrate-binding protein [Microbacterium sp. 179-I 3D2 NHS]|uniref:ABC transporter substrate-binding protein n=1 Tax=Microbacterium sp. 179-I 3D2 NHS TaxID=3235178 RepID=UPI0039A21372
MKITRQWKAFAIGGLSAALIGSLSGCTPGAEETGSDLDFTYWSFAAEEEPQAQAIAAIIEKYENETGAEVDIEWQGRQVVTQVTTNLLGGDVPDLVDQDAGSLGSLLIEPGETVSLKDVYAEQIPGEDKTVGDVINQSVVDLVPDYAGDGEPHYLPLSIAGGLFLFNANDPLVSEAPETWDDVLAVCEEAKAAGRACFGVDGDVGYYVDLYLENLLVRYGGPGAVKNLIEDESGAGWDTPAVKKTFEEVEKLVKAGYFGEGYKASKWPQQQNDWAAGKSVFHVNASYVINETKDFQAEGFEVGATAFPITDNPEFDSTDVLSFGFVVLKQGEHTEGAKKFLSYLYKKENLEEYAATALAVVARPDAELPAEIQATADVYNQENLRATFETTVPGDYYAKVLDVSFATMVLGGLTAEEAIAKGRAEHVTFWENQ